MGWNGVKIHCQGKAWELGKDSSFTSESQDADIMVDVQDARVSYNGRRWDESPPPLQIQTLLRIVRTLLEC